MLRSYYGTPSVAACEESNSHKLERVMERLKQLKEIRNKNWESMLSIYREDLDYDTRKALFAIEGSCSFEIYLAEVERDGLMEKIESEGTAS
jgi:hypothetical protein